MYFEVSHNPICTEDGNVIGVAVFAQDITDRKQAEEALRESEEQYHVLFQGAAEGGWLQTLRQRSFMSANPAQCRMLGYTKDELEQMSIGDIHPQKDLERVMDELMAQAHGEKTVGVGIPDVHAKTDPL